MKNKESIADIIVNAFLKIRREILVKVFSKKYGSDEPTHLKAIIGIKSYDGLFEGEWFSGQKWGAYHPAGLHQYWFCGSFKDDELISPAKNGFQLGLTYMPKDFLVNGETVTIPYRMAILQSKRFFKRGFFKFTVSIPYGKGLWPAIWLSGKDTWPPEVDILESLSDDNYKYSHESNFHIGNNGATHINVGASAHKISDMSNATFSCWYEPDKFIKIYYDGYLIRKITSKNILMWYQYYPDMSILINTACRPEFATKNKVTQESNFIIKSIEISQ